MFRTAMILAALAAVSLYSQTPSPALVQKSGPYQVTLRPPADGLFAGEEMQIEFRVEDTSKDDPLTGFAPVIRAKIQSEIDMPSMRGMPIIKETGHSEGVPGDYGLHPVFVHGGEYRLRINIEPPRAAAFTVEFRLNVGDERPKGAKVESPYKLKLDRAGDGLTVRIFGPEGPVQDFDIVHEKSMHLIIVSKDLKQFAHTHPELKPDGTFVLKQIPMSGDLRIFADFAPRGKGGQVLNLPWKQAGKREAPADKVLAPATLVPVKGAWKAGRTQEVLLEGGAPLASLEPYLGAMAHLVMIHEDAETFVHAHPLDDPAKIVFLARPPKPGRYRGWVETQSKGQVYRQSFDIEVPANAGD
jgi:hypothetical protein